MLIDAPLLDFDVFHRVDLPARAGAIRGREAACDVRDVTPLAIGLTDGRAYTYVPAGNSIAIAAGIDGPALTVELSLRAWSDLVQEIRTVPALIFAAEIRVTRGDPELLRRWLPALRALYAGVPIYDPQAVDLRDRNGEPLDLQRSYTLGDATDEMRHFFRRAGFLHLRHVFSADEIAALRAVVDELQVAARPGDDRSWWAKDASGRPVLCRLVYTGLSAPRIAALDDDPRIRRIIGLTGLDLRPAPDRQEGHSVVIKNPGVVEGLSDLPWHQDCGLGGHPITCPAIGIGVQLEPATAETGQLHVLAGSQGASCHPFGEAELAHLPRVALTTHAGDCTVHIADVMHAAPPPQGAGPGRRTLYVSFFSPRMFDYIGPGQAYNDIVRRRRADGHAAHTDEILAGRA